ncbi:MAG: hypothetical protein V4508_02340 [Pseudomonadota bacterium]
MTVIAWDGKTLAADKRATSVGNPATTTKIFRLKNGCLVGMCGDADAGRVLIDWFEVGAHPSTFPDNRDSDNRCRVVLLIITPDRKVHQLQRTHRLVTFEDKFTAIGSGRDYALAAMHLGFDALKAVEVACALDVDCGNGIDLLEFAS